MNEPREDGLPTPERSKPHTWTTPSQLRWPNPYGAPEAEASPEQGSPEPHGLGEPEQGSVGRVVSPEQPAPVVEDDYRRFAPPVPAAPGRDTDHSLAPAEQSGQETPGEVHDQTGSASSTPLPVSADEQESTRVDAGNELPWRATSPVDAVPAAAVAVPQGGPRGMSSSEFPWIEPAPPVPGGVSAEGTARRDRRRARRGVPRITLVLSVLVALLAGFVGGAVVGREYLSSGAGQRIPSTSGAPAGADRPADSVAGIAAATLDSTVYIEAAGTAGLSSGTGMILTADGYIVTNNHVVAGAAESGAIRVTFSDGTEAAGELVGGTVDYDIAVVEVDRDGLVPLVLGDSDTVVVGDPVVAVGAPLGLEGTVTSGIVSALDRPVQAGPADSDGSTFLNAIQTDAAINPGNSGGPLVNISGEVIGINTAIAQASGQPTGNIGLGFAIPSNQVRRTAEQIIDTGEATYPIIGIMLNSGYSGEGVQIVSEDEAGDSPPITPNGPASGVNLRPGDLVLRLDGRPVTTPAELIVAVRARAPGEEVELSVRRGSEEFEVTIVLGEARSGG